MRERFIPAGAGNTICAPRDLYGAAVYPRWRGEHCDLGHDTLLNIGLSPLARGTRGFSHPEPRHARFIPAGAGNTTKSAARSPALTVYPRWRGEHLPIVVSAASEHGLSPLARGTLADSDNQLQRVRFIPAGAGNTDVSVVWDVKDAVYPRWRGEHARWAVDRC